MFSATVFFWASSPHIRKRVLGSVLVTESRDDCFFCPVSLPPTARFNSPAGIFCDAVPAPSRRTRLGFQDDSQACIASRPSRAAAGWQGQIAKAPDVRRAHCLPFSRTVCPSPAFATSSTCQMGRLRREGRATAIPSSSKFGSDELLNATLCCYFVTHLLDPRPAA